MPDSLKARYQQRPSHTDAKRKQALWVSLLQALVVLALLLACARFVTVLVLSFREEPVFSAPKTIYLPQRQLEHQMAVAEFQNAAATPATIPQLTTQSLLASAPALPSLPDVNFTPVENDVLISESDALFGQSGLMGALGALSSQASSVSFLGIREEASRFVIVMDISGSVVNSAAASGVDFNSIREEAKRLIQNLNANTLFGFVQHARRFDSFQDHLIPATVANKQLSTSWLDRKFRTSGTSGSGWRTGADGSDGILPILDFVFSMQPDVIFLISDGGYFSSADNRPVPLQHVLRLINQRQKDLPQNARIHAIHFPDPRNIQDGRIGNDMRRIATSNKGQYRRIGNE